MTPDGTTRRALWGNLRRRLSAAGVVAVAHGAIGDAPDGRSRRRATGAAGQESSVTRSRRSPSDSSVSNGWW
jgi:hypothetical protein